jgi:hypothetical protein
MKLLAAAIALSLLGSVAAEARPKLPKPIDSPVVRPKVRDDHKAGKRIGKHPERFYRPEWGAAWGQTLNMKRKHEIPEYLKESQQ